MHTPSEHYVDGKRHAMELHLAHASTTGKTAVDASVHRRRALEHRADAAPFQCRNRAHCAAFIRTTRARCRPSTIAKRVTRQLTDRLRGVGLARPIPRSGFHRRWRRSVGILS
ncbi:carbonic anhydrase family protein [Stenotrophomonas maltophilia]|nr:carbonic anhydrase family protein [Stenotrophomonas maltophilia]